MIYYNVMKTLFFLIFIVLIMSSCISGERIKQINESDFHKEIGFAYYIEKNYQLAYSEFHKALQIDPKNKDALHGLALVHMEFQEYETAKELFLKTLSIDPNYADAWFNLGVCYQRLNMHNEAIDSFNKALNNPNFTTQDKAYFGKGLSYYRMGKYEEAKKSFDKAIKRNILLIQAHLYLALANQKLGLYSEALKTLRNGIKLDQIYKGDVDKFKKDLIEASHYGQEILPKEDILDLLEILRY
ncbi:MAG: tetratricopeptide repeat protein [Thermodesulfovibrio sp.]|nr:tetratricopeptide repeat protein [Thermodesulfovibrio sp.]MCX7723963.1 tetratricopeptide repeat protein [Thermodesulfovibrio sp.]MDW7972138.1 tetratricopeptide repeat protein [Thermodesulfovibrio sp.]